jgi:hypothetical protein
MTCIFAIVALAKEIRLLVLAKAFGYKLGQALDALQKHSDYVNLGIAYVRNSTSRCPEIAENWVVRLLLQLLDIDKETATLASLMCSTFTQENGGKGGPVEVLAGYSLMKGFSKKSVGQFVETVFGDSGRRCLSEGAQKRCLPEFKWDEKWMEDRLTKESRLVDKEKAAHQRMLEHPGSMICPSHLSGPDVVAYTSDGMVVIASQIANKDLKAVVDHNAPFFEDLTFYKNRDDGGINTLVATRKRNSLLVNLALCHRGASKKLKTEQLVKEDPSSGNVTVTVTSDHIPTFFQHPASAIVNTFVENVGFVFSD